MIVELDILGTNELHPAVHGTPFHRLLLADGSRSPRHTSDRNLSEGLNNRPDIKEI